MVLQSINTDNCPRCAKNSLLTDDVTGERFCGKCGYVISEKSQESGPEWRSFTQDEHGNKARAGAPTSLTMHDMGLSTIINPMNKDASGKPLTASMKSTIERLRTWDSRSQVHESVDRNLRQALSELNRLKDKLSLSDAVIESALYAACRDTETPRTLNDVGEAANLKKKDIARCYRLLHRELELKMPVVDPIQCLARIASRIGITEKTKRYAAKVLKISQEHEESAGKDPMGLAAAALYLACVKNGEDITQRDIAEAASVTEVTIRNRYKGLKLDQNMEL